MQTTRFTKMHGAGNDFILLNNLDKSLPTPSPHWIQDICLRHEGIGADGVIILQKDPDYDFSMLFFNSDGHTASMCGNAARCIARYAHDHADIPARMTFRTAAGPIHASVGPDNRVSIELTTPHSIKRNINIPEANVTADFIDTGVPHAVVFADSIDMQDFHTFGKIIRNSTAFQPEGTNVNLVQCGDHCLNIRTYERGVEAETLACGTGIAACALIAHLEFDIPSPVQIKCAHGDQLTVTFEYTGESFRHVCLQGPAEYCFNGIIPTPDICQGK